MSTFKLQGFYRVQSRRDYASSVLEGEWFRASELICNDKINRALRLNPSWQGTAQVLLRPALISFRSGKFASEADILYKREFFIPSFGIGTMETDIVDILKAKKNWNTRVKYLQMLFPDDYLQIMQQLDDLELIIANEYMLHEAGHFLAYDVYAKQQDKYFTVMGNTAWPLIYLEELRADLNAFGFALQLLPPEKASQIFLYNLMLRFGVHCEGVSQNLLAPYGLVPYLLFYLLEKSGFISLHKKNGYSYFRLRSLEIRKLTEIMSVIACHAENELNASPLTVGTTLNCAITAASYVRHRLDDKQNVTNFTKVMNQFSVTIK